MKTRNEPQIRLVYASYFTLTAIVSLIKMWWANNSIFCGLPFVFLTLLTYNLNPCFTALSFSWELMPSTSPLAAWHRAAWWHHNQSYKINQNINNKLCIPPLYSFSSKTLIFCDVTSFSSQIPIEIITTKSHYDYSDASKRDQNMTIQFHNFLEYDCKSIV